VRLHDPLDLHAPHHARARSARTVRACARARNESRQARVGARGEARLLGRDVVVLSGAHGLGERLGRGVFD